MNGGASVGRVLYRQILRFAKAVDNIPFEVRESDIARCCPSVFTLDHASGGAEGLRSLARMAFRQDACAVSVFRMLVMACAERLVSTQHRGA